MESAFLGHLMSSSKHRTNVERLKTKARTGVWDENHFFDWLKEATVEDWTEVEELWQRAHCSELLNWPALRQSLECTARKEDVSPLHVLGAFLYPSNGMGYEGYWLDWQKPEIRKEVYRTAQTWLERVPQPTAQQALTLLNIARDAQCMAEWRIAPEGCVASLEWLAGMRALNYRATLDDLNLEDIRRVPTHDLFEGGPVDAWAMVKCYDENYRVVARCLEVHAGPGLWIKYVMNGTERGVEYKRRLAWQYMKLDGVDAWALSEYIQPSALFEQSVEQLGSEHEIHHYLTWARGWWLECQLGMTPVRALSLAEHIPRGSNVEPVVEFHDVSHSLF